MKLNFRCRQSPAEYKMYFSTQKGLHSTSEKLTWSQRLIRNILCSLGLMILNQEIREKENSSLEKNHIFTFNKKVRIFKSNSKTLVSVDGKYKS